MTRTQKRIQKIHLLRRQLEKRRARHRTVSDKQTILVWLIVDQLKYEMRKRAA